MKRIPLIVVMFVTIFSLSSNRLFAQQMESRKVALEATGQIPDTADRSNNFYDNEKTYPLQGSDIEISGEIKNPGKLMLTGMQKRSVIVKETRYFDEKGEKFIGAYRYDGYSLFDILNNRLLQKKNAKDFEPIIDLYVIVENDKGEKTVLSWGEIYYPSQLHQILIATEVSPIVPSKTKDQWPLPTKTRLVVAHDLLTERNIENPVKITVVSYPRSISVNRQVNPAFSPDIQVFSDGKPVELLSVVPANLQKETYRTTFYGRGRGIHSTTPFTGIELREYLARFFPLTEGRLKTGIFAIAGKDGYRAVYTYSEVMNRNDQAELLLVDCPGDTENGKFRVFPAADFFSDRAVKTVSAIYFENSVK